MRSMSISSERDRAGAAAVAAAAAGTELTCGGGSGSRISALSPLPSAFLGIGDDLLGKLDVGFSASTMNVVEDDWLPVAWRLGQTDIARNHSFKHLGAEEAAEIRSYLAGESGALVVHG